MKCENCGNDLKESDEFCNQCGNKKVLDEKNKSEEENLCVWIFILIFFILIALGIFVNELIFFLALVDLVIGVLVYLKSKVLRNMLVTYGTILLIFTIIIIVGAIACSSCIDGLRG